MKKERSICEILVEDYGFIDTVIDVPIDSFQKYKSFLPNFILKKFPVKTKKVTLEFSLSGVVNKNLFRVYLSDLWYTVIEKNGEVIFDQRRFTNEEFFSLIN